MSGEPATERVTMEVPIGAVETARRLAEQMGIPEREFWIVAVGGGVGLAVTHPVSFVCALNRWRNGGWQKGDNAYRG